ncbi:MAG: hypothetical protein V2J55_14455 [Candidatus Competibacteraceae bacterium]|jgi:hypothetical protein|nr:hypothetical protein [Candidatus Competibacteraceae bacterium]
MLVSDTPLILDACCIINLHVSGRIADILSALPVPIIMSETVKSFELLSLQKLDALSASHSGKFQTAIDRGLITVTDFETEEERANFVNYAAVLGDDGEAATFAIAAARGYAVATDDRKALNFAAQELPHLPLINTPHLVKQWVDNNSTQREAHREVLQNIRQLGRYLPPKAHPLYEWWMLILE